MATRTSAAGLTVEAIVDAATRIGEKDRFESISMRRVAADLGVTAMALYKHVPTKNALLDLIANTYLADLDLAEDVSQWDERLRRIFRSFHELMVEHPVLAHVAANQTLEGPSARRMAEVVLAILRNNGFGDAEAVEIFSVLASFTVGLTLSWRARLPTDEADVAERMSELAADPEHPHLSAVAEHYVKWPEQQVFDHGLDALIDSYTRRRAAR
jgi:TetR/AcrR family tetracycline transcriptional repressor